MTSKEEVETKKLIDRELKRAKQTQTTRIYKKFNPLDYVPQEKLLYYLADIGNDLKPNETPGMDSSVVKINVGGQEMFMVSTTDFFYPLVDDPYLQGKIACANVLSDLYAMAVTEVDTMLMLLGCSREMTPVERDVATTLMIRGFNDHAREAKTNVTGGQTVLNPWPIIGGVAMSTRLPSQIIRPENAVAGDAIILTKPLGTQVAVNVYEWLRKPCRWSLVENVLSRDDAIVAYEKAVESMVRLNQNGAKLMHKYGAHSATDVTGFGILGHLSNQAKSQKASVDFVLEKLPIIKHMPEVNVACENMFRLIDGYSAETSGGLLLCLPAEAAEAFIAELEELDGQAAWIVGKVVEGTNTARIERDPVIVEV